MWFTITVYILKSQTTVELARRHHNSFSSFFVRNALHYVRTMKYFITVLFKWVERSYVYLNRNPLSPFFKHAVYRCLNYIWLWKKYCYQRIKLTIEYFRLKNIKFRNRIQDGNPKLSIAHFKSFQSFAYVS